MQEEPRSYTPPCTNPRCSRYAGNRIEATTNLPGYAPQAPAPKAMWPALIAAGLLQLSLGIAFVYMWGINHNSELTLTPGTLVGSLLLCIGAVWLLFLWLIAGPTLRNPGKQAINSNSRICPICGNDTELSSYTQQADDRKSTTSL